MHKKSSTIALTMGDPAGIGPEITVKALSRQESLPPECHLFVIGDYGVMAEAAKLMHSAIPLHNIESLEDYNRGHINILDQRVITPDQFAIGTVNKVCGAAAYRYIEKSIELANNSAIDAIVTNPIHKVSLKLSGINFPGHTEIYAHATDTADYSMFFMLDNIFVAHVTRHCSLKEAIARITKTSVLTNIRLLNTTIKEFGIEKPMIAVGGLNPHAGEEGLFGTEEIEHIKPAIEQAQKEGIAVSGPFSADTIYVEAFKGKFNGIVSMLHDHGFVALKSRDFEHGVNITIGLPIIRTSVGHGTAFDIAGQGIASEKSLVSAIQTAHIMSLQKKKMD